MTVLKNINANNFLNIKILKIKIIFLKSLEKDDFNGIKTARNKQILRKLYVFKLRVSVFSGHTVHDDSYSQSSTYIYTG